MKEKIEAARRARELASPRPHPKKRAGSFSGGRCTSKSGTGAGAAAAAAAAAAVGGSGSSGAVGGEGGFGWGQSGVPPKAGAGRKSSNGRKSRSSDCSRLVMLVMICPLGGGLGGRNTAPPSEVIFSRWVPELKLKQSIFVRIVLYYYRLRIASTISYRFCYL